MLFFFFYSYFGPITYLIAEIIEAKSKNDHRVVCRRKLKKPFKTKEAGINI